MKKISCFFVALTLSAIMLLVTGCHSKDDNYFDNNTEDTIMLSYFDSSLPEGIVEFTHSIMDFEDFFLIIPLGQINPPEHTFPTDHIYFMINGINKPVYAPAKGKILFIEEPGMYGDRAIRVAVSNTMTYYLGHIFVEQGLKVGDTIDTGAKIGTVGNTACVDFGLLNKNAVNEYISKKLPLTTIYADRPLAYYKEPLRAQLYSLVKPPQPANEPDYVYSKGVTDGRLVYDKSGTLCGNWFLEGGFEPNGWYNWDITLFFGYDHYYPDQIRIGIGKELPYQHFAIKNEDNPQKPDNVTTASGAVAYYLYSAKNIGSFGLPMGERIGLLMVEMLSDTEIKLEIFDDKTSASREFTSDVLYYQR